MNTTDQSPETQDPQCESGRVAVDGKRTDDDHVYLVLYLRCLRLRSNGFSSVVPLDTARWLRDQLTEHLNAAK